MRKLLFAGALLLSSSALLAEECNVDIDGNITFENKVLSIRTKDNTEIMINHDYTLFVNGGQISTNAQQQQWLTDYYDGIHAAIPEAAGIAGEALALASDAVNQAFDRLLGKESEVLDKLNTSMAKISQSIQRKFYAEDGAIRFTSDSHDKPAFGQEWEEQFEQEIEEIVTQSIGSLMVALGSQLMFSGGDMDEFEKKMEKFGNEIEQSVTLRSEEIEKKAGAFCARLAKIDYAELKLQQHVKGLEDLDILQVKDYELAM